LSILKESDYVLDLATTPATTESLGRIGPYSLGEVADNALVSLAVPQSRLSRALEHLHYRYGLELPDPEAVYTNSANSQSIFWTARNQWMIERPELQDPNWATRLASAQVGYVTEQTGAWARFDLEGPGLELVLQRLTNVDSARWVDSVAIRTSMHHLGVFVVCRGSVISIYGPRSSADSLARAVKFAMRTVKGLEDDHEI
jgi:sarcosine oxidase subunit gamma